MYASYSRPFHGILHRRALAAALTAPLWLFILTTNTACGNGTNSVNCGERSDECAGTCVDLQVNPDNCGACGNACLAGEACSGGACVASCPEGTSECDRACVYTDIDPDHCGSCGEVCDRYDNAYSVCASGTCLTAGCMDGFADCNSDLEADGCETDVATSNSSCGQCGRTCAATEICVAGVCQLDGSLEERFGLQVGGLVVDPGMCTTVEHSGETGDDRGALAVAGSHYFYMGDDSGVRFDLPGLGGATQVAREDSIFSDLSGGTLYSLTMGGVPVGYPACDISVDGFVELDPNNLSPVGQVTPLSMPVPLSCDGISRPGVFSGRNLLVLHNESRETYVVTLPEGDVFDGGVSLDLNGGQGCESWAMWGIAEYAQGEISVVYRSQFAPNGIVRQSLTSGEVELIQDLSSLDVSNLCSIGADLDNDQWVWQYQGSGDLDAGGNTQTAGACPATFAVPTQN